MAVKPEGNAVVRFLLEIRDLLINWKFVLPFLLNQLGSVAYVNTLGSSDISLAQPICNSLAFFFTAITSRFLGEKPLTLYSIIGMILVLSGVAICVQSKNN